ncbi:MAG: hypothetical protein HQL32_12960 [Planctomycetes bacterium]|nr:hypothetical protein [Planctomycetota bacterium]
MNRVKGFLILVHLLLALGLNTIQAQNQYVGYVYPAGGQQGTTFTIRLGGQKLAHTSGLSVCGEGVSVRLVDHYKVMDNQEQKLLRAQLKELKKKNSTISDSMVEKMAWFEFPSSARPPEVSGLVCPACGGLSPLGTKVCQDCNAPLPKPSKKDNKKSTLKRIPTNSEKELAKQNLIERIERIFAADERNPAVRAHTELIFAEVTIDADAAPGRREIRVQTKKGVSNPLPFYVGQVPEVARKPMKTWKKPTLGKESLAQRKRPPDEAEYTIPIPCTMNGQIACGEVNRYRFKASKGQEIVVTCKARDLVPYVADGVPGWFQAVLRIHNDAGHEVAYNDDYRFNPDPTLLFTVPEDGEYVLTINDAIFRGRESFTYRITIGELPFLTSIFPLGGGVGKQTKVDMEGLNLEKAVVKTPPKGAQKGRYLVAASVQKSISNKTHFSLDTLPEYRDKEVKDDSSKAQKVTLPVIINGRSDHPGDWDVFEVQGKAGETIVTEVMARRLGSPFDSFIKITNSEGKVIALNDDHLDVASGLATDHADSYLMTKLPVDGIYYVHISDTRRHAGKAYSYRLRISQPMPDFELRVVPSRITLRGKKDGWPVTIYAIRRDGFNKPIKLKFENLPEGVTSPGATLWDNKESIKIKLSNKLKSMDEPVLVNLVGTASVEGKTIINKAIPAEDRMQAFLWRHLVPAEDLPLYVYDYGYKAPVKRIRPPIAEEDIPADVKPTWRKSAVDTHLRRVKGLYQQWLLTDEFANREIAAVEAKLIN